MKPWHIGLVVVGAAVAGGLAVKMTEPMAFHRTTATRVAAAAPAPVAPALQPATEAQVDSPPVATAPPPVYAEEKPSPVHASPAKPAPVWRPALKTPARANIPAAPKTPQPNVIARTEPAPPQMPAPAPVPYQTPPATAQPDAPAQPVEISQAPEVPPPPMPLKPVLLQVTLRQGSQIAVRLDQTISSDHLSAGDTFQASLAEPLVVDGYVIAEKGARASGRVIDSKNAGRLTGNSALQLALSSFQTSDGQKVAISTEPWVKQGGSSRNQDVAKIGGGAALGAIIGAIAGGGKGAAIGAGVGGAAGTGAAAATGAKPVIIPSETVIKFRLASRVSVTERPL